MDYDYPFLTKQDDHLDTREYLQEALAIASLMEKVDRSKLKESTHILYHPSGFDPINILMRIIRQKIFHAFENIESAHSTDDPGVLFEYIFDQMKYPPIGEKKITYITEVFGRLIKKMQRDQRGEVQDPEKDDPEKVVKPVEIPSQSDPQPEDENENPDKIEKPEKKIYPTKQAIHACEIQLEVAGNMLREMKESMAPENQEFQESEKEATV